MIIDCFCLLIYFDWCRRRTCQGIGPKQWQLMLPVSCILVNDVIVIIIIITGYLILNSISLKFTIPTMIYVFCYVITLRTLHIACYVNVMFNPVISRSNRGAYETFVSIIVGR